MMDTAMGKRSSQARTHNRPHVLLVDTHQDCLLTLQSMFQERNFRVTRCHDSERCLAMIRKKKQAFDLAVIEARMPGIDGLELIKLLRKETLIPIILMSRDIEVDVIRKGMEYGACDFLQKPISMEQVGAIDLGVLRARVANNVAAEEEDSNNSRNLATNMVDSGSLSGNSRNPSVDSGSVDSQLGVVEQEGDPINCLDQPRNRKRRVIWTPELHTKFVEAVQLFGVTNAVPKKILQAMNDPNLTRENIASHLQKYRQLLKKEGGAPQQPNAAVVAETQTIPNPIPMATLPRLYDESNVNAYHNATSSLCYGPEETALPITQTVFSNMTEMLPQNDMGYVTDPIMDWMQQIPPIGEPDILSHNSMNQTPMPGGGSLLPPANYGEELLSNFGNSLGGHQGGADPLTVYDYMHPNVFNQGSYDPTLHHNHNHLHQQPNQATGGDQFYFPDFPQDKPKFG